MVVCFFAVVRIQWLLSRDGHCIERFGTFLQRDIAKVDIAAQGYGQHYLLMTYMSDNEQIFSLTLDMEEKSSVIIPCRANDEGAVGSIDEDTIGIGDHRLGVVHGSTLYAESLVSLSD